MMGLHSLLLSSLVWQAASFVAVRNQQTLLKNPQTHHNPLGAAVKGHVDIVVGNTVHTIPNSQARTARTGQKKVYLYKLVVDQVAGQEDAIKAVEFFPDFVDDTYLPRSYKKTSGPPFQTQHDCWGMSTARLLITMSDGTVKTLYKKIKNTSPQKNARAYRLVHKPQKKKNTDKPFKPMTGRAFGVELELVAPKTFKPRNARDAIKRVTNKECLVTGWNPKTLRAWKVETDSSITHKQNQYGMEVVSPVLRGEGGIDYVKKVANELCKQNCIANGSCGLHVHMDLSNVKLDDLKRICLAWIKYEDALDLLIVPHRRNSKNPYCLNVRDNMKLGSLNNADAANLVAQQTSRPNLARVMNAHPQNRQRYHKLNLWNLADPNKPQKSRNTIEFRGHEGTCNPGEVEHWVRLLNTFVERALDSSYNDLHPFDDDQTAKYELNHFFAFLADPDLKEYYRGFAQHNAE